MRNASAAVVTRLQSGSHTQELHGTAEPTALRSTESASLEVKD
jgi:hypothetical protein